MGSTRDSTGAGLARPVVAAVAALSVVPLAVQTVRAVRDLRPFYVDVRIWNALAENVLSGAALYQAAGATDLKPPGWLLLSVAGEALFDATLVIVAVTAAARIAAVWYAYALGTELTDDPRAGAIAAALLAAVFVLLYTPPNNKTLVAVLGLYGLRTDRRVRAGAALGLALATVQYALLLVPPVALRWYRAGGRSDAARVVAVAALALAASYAALLWWGVASLVNGLLYSYGVALQYVLETPLPNTVYGVGTGSPFTSPGEWLVDVVRHAAGTSPVLLAAALALVGRGSLDAVVPSARQQRRAALLALLAGCLSVALVVRAYRHYWTMVAVAVAPLSAVGVERWLPSRP